MVLAIVDENQAQAKSLVRKHLYFSDKYWDLLLVGPSTIVGKYKFLSIKQHIQGNNLDFLLLKTIYSPNSLESDWFLFVWRDRKSRGRDVVSFFVAGGREQTAK